MIFSILFSAAAKKEKIEPENSLEWMLKPFWCCILDWTSNRVVQADGQLHQWWQMMDVGRYCIFNFKGNTLKCELGGQSSAYNSL